MKRDFVIYVDGQEVSIPRVSRVNGEEPSDSLGLFVHGTQRGWITLETDSGRVYHFAASHIAGFRSSEVEAHPGGPQIAYSGVKL